MASSGSKSVKVTDHNTLKFSWKNDGQSVVYNTTTISWSMELSSDAFGAISSSSKKSWNITVDGKEYSGMTNVGISANSVITLASGSTIITHNSDGSKVFSYSFSQYFGITFSGESIGTVSGTGSGTLNTIARASQPSCITWPEHTQDVGYFGDEISIHMNRKSSSFTHTVRYAFGSLSGTIATGVGTGTTWVIPNSFMDLLPAATVGSGTIYVDTYNGSTLVGTKYCGFTAKIRDSVKPGVSFSLEDITGVDDIYGSPVKGLSKIKVTVTATPAYSSPITSCAISANGSSYSGTTATTDVLKTSGSSRVTATVKDKRGRSNSVYYDMNVQDYTAPSVSALSIHRCNEDGTANDQGGYVKATFSATVSSMNSKNTATYILKYKKSSATSYTNVPISALANNYAVSNYSYIFAADANSSYDVEVTVQDRHKTASRNTSASTAFTLLNFNPQGNGIGVGQVCERENAFQVGMAADFAEALRAKKGISIEDTRYNNFSPSEYRAMGRQYVVEFKQCASIGLYDTTHSFCTVITFIQWQDTSGGSVKQLLLDDDRIWYRHGGDSWGSWRPVLYRTDWQSIENGVSYKIRDGMCTVRGNSNTFSISPSGVVACTLPEVARPTVDVYGSMTTKANTCGQFCVGTNGTVTLWNLSTTSGYWAFTVSYPID